MLLLDPPLWQRYAQEPRQLVDHAVSGWAVPLHVCSTPDQSKRVGGQKPARRLGWRIGQASQGRMPHLHANAEALCFDLVDPRGNVCHSKINDNY